MAAEAVALWVAVLFAGDRLVHGAFPDRATCLQEVARAEAQVVAERAPGVMVSDCVEVRLRPVSLPAGEGAK